MFMIVSQNLGVSPAFLIYLNQLAPSLYWQLPLDCLTFRWKIPKQECLSGWTSKRSGVDIITDLRTEEICGISGLHFPGKTFLRILVSEHEGPYRAEYLIDRLSVFLESHGESLGEHEDLIKQNAQRADELGCVLNYSSDDIILQERSLAHRDEGSSTIMTRVEYEKLFYQGEKQH
jgi:hypothetical protein